MKSIKQHIVDFKKPTPAKWRKIGDFALLTIPVIDGILLSIPTKWMDMEMTKFLSSIWSLLALGIKFWTNTHKEDETWTTILISVITLFSCNSEKRLQKAINKHGQKESISYVVGKYPEYFATTTKIDTIFHADTTYIQADSLASNGFNCDSIFNALKDGTNVVLAENDNLKLMLSRYNNKLKFQANLKPDTVYREIKVPFKVEVPCPDVNKLDTTIVPMLEQRLSTARHTIVASWIISLLLISLIILYFTKKQK